VKTAQPRKTFDTVKIPRLNFGARYRPTDKLVYIINQNFSNLWLQPAWRARRSLLTDFTSGDILRGTSVFRRTASRFACRPWLPDSRCGVDKKT